MKRGIGWDRRASAAGRWLAHGSVAVLVGGLGLALLFGMAPLRARAEGRLGERPARVVIEWPELTGGGGVGDGKARTTWLPADARERLTDLVRGELSEGRAALSGDGPRRAGQALARSGWFERQPRVEWRSGGELHVSGVWRLPAAAVEHGGKYYLVSRRGQRMPMVYEPGSPKPVTIEGIEGAPPRLASGEGDYATAWPGEDLGAALELVALVRAQPWGGQMAGVRVGDTRDGVERMTILTTPGGRVVWGGRPGKPRLGECSTPMKLSKISQLSARFGRIDGGQDAVEVFWEKEPLMIDISATGGQP